MSVICEITVRDTVPLKKKERVSLIALSRPNAGAGGRGRTDGLLFTKLQPFTYELRTLVDTSGRLSPLTRIVSQKTPLKGGCQRTRTDVRPVRDTVRAVRDTVLFGGVV